jgi:hypothetical protein
VDKTKRNKGLLLLIAAFSIVAATPFAEAAPITLQFASTVSAVDPSAAGFPSALSGTTAGDTFTASITYDPLSAVATQIPRLNPPFASLFDTAYGYALPGASVSITVGGTTFNNWTGTIKAFVWNDADLNHVGSLSDGLIFTDIATIPGDAQFRIGNFLMPVDTFSSGALPTGALDGPFIAVLNAAGSTQEWASSGASSFMLASPTTSIPEPDTYAMLLIGLALLGCTRRRIETAKSNLLLPAHAENPSSAKV